MYLVSVHRAIYRSKDCWFCLSSANVESQLIISVGENFYCALAKGPLVQDHVLVIPVEHSPNTLSLPPECEIDLGRFQNSLKKYYKNQGKEVVFFEWVSKRSSHANLQVKKGSAFRVKVRCIMLDLMNFNSFSPKKKNFNSYFYIRLLEVCLLSAYACKNSRSLLLL